MWLSLFGNGTGSRLGGVRSGSSKTDDDGVRAKFADSLRVKAEAAVSKARKIHKKRMIPPCGSLANFYSEVKATKC